MRYPRCEAENPKGRKFYIACAAPLTPGRPHCGFARPSRAKCCGQCAASPSGSLPAAAAPLHAPDSHTLLSYTPTHLAEKILRAKTALEGGSEEVTVLFAGLKGSMRWSADHDPTVDLQKAQALLEKLA
jgi:hypothetical protein